MIALTTRHRSVEIMHGDRVTFLFWAMACIVGMWPTLACAGMQHLVAPGESWEQLAAKVQPGDEIILMPGRHKPANFERLQGAKDAPITIRGLDAENKSVIQAARHGILITDPRHVVIANLDITGASIAGIALRSIHRADAPHPGEAGSALNPAYVQLRNVTISKVGPTGRRDAVEILGQDRVSIEQCSFDGWAGAAVAAIACANITIDGCTFKGQPDHSQTEAILMRAGTQNVTIERCMFELLAGPGIVAGGKSEPDAFQPPLMPDAPQRSVFEASAVQVMHCVFVNAKFPIVMRSADDILVRNCTFIRPKACLMLFEHQHDDPRMALPARLIFGGNIITWQRDDLATLYVATAGEFDLRHLTWEENLWWSDATIEQRSKLGELQGGLVSDQVHDIDPRLDEKHRPQNPDAAVFGAFAP